MNRAIPPIIGMVGLLAIAHCTTMANATDRRPVPRPMPATPLILLEDKRGTQENEGCVFKLVGETDTHIAVEVYWCGQDLLIANRTNLLRKDDFDYVRAAPLLEQLR